MYLSQVLPAEVSFACRKRNTRPVSSGIASGFMARPTFRFPGLNVTAQAGTGFISAKAQGYSADIRIINSGFDNNRRQGMSLVSGRNILISGCSSTNTTGTAPAAGLDVEPNGVIDLLQGIEIVNSFAAGNDGNGLVFAVGRMDSTSNPISVNVSSFTSQGNHLSGFFASNEQDGPNYSVPGTIEINNSVSAEDVQYGAIASYWEAGGTALTFQNLTVVNANSSRTNIDNAAITIKRGGGASHPMGNVHFYGTSVIDTMGNLDVYFTVYDWSNIGITQLQFLAPMELSGANELTGLFNGYPALTLDAN